MPAQPQTFGLTMLEAAVRNTNPLAEIWQTERGQLPGLSAMSAQRVSKCKARLSVTGFSLEDFRQAVRLASGNAFLNGDNSRNWKATFDWFIANDTNYRKVLEGQYQGGNGNGNTAKHESYEERRSRQNREVIDRVIARRDSSVG